VFYVPRPGLAQTVILVGTPACPRSTPTVMCCASWPAGCQAAPRAGCAGSSR
jgi:hypothetical protein